jgi:diguanylate cyclase (GGDEF)-like protein
VSDPKDGRIDPIIELLTGLATGDLTARGTVSKAEDDLDAIVVGINMLAEELEASRVELEQRVQARTVALERLNRDILQLADLGNVLQACETVDEASEVTAHGLNAMFEGMSGAMYLYKASKDMLVSEATWGATHTTDLVAPTGCWALRRGQQHVVQGSNPQLSCQHVAKRTGDSICVPMSAHGETIGLLHVMSAEPEDTASTEVLSQAKQQLAKAVAEQTALAFANLDLRDRLRVQALRDPLTGLYNRRFVDEWLEREVNRTDRSGNSLGVIMADIDHFKRINDVHGHNAGDELLKAVADALQASLRPGDLPCRYGGEEFLILVVDIGFDALVQRAEQLRKNVATVRVDYRGETLPAVTLSAGVALYPQDGSTASEVIVAADTALYSAKRAGRNRTLATGVEG